jgi:hypothetical protein
MRAVSAELVAGYDRPIDKVKKLIGYNGRQARPMQYVSLDVVSPIHEAGPQNCQAQHCSDATSGQLPNSAPRPDAAITLKIQGNCSDHTKNELDGMK